ncbi:MAG TPA: glycosyltransferase family 39 protein [Chitinophagaceae bacterium]|nr:glycosyltransferase family 39 protein [Chitinophagaceae bacterium]
MNAFLSKHHRRLFYAAWLLLGLAQATCTQLIDDEAYYWVYSRFLDWGYFDHPPMVALMIRAGTALLPGGLGVRLLAVLMNTGTLLLTEQLTDRRHPGLFYAISLSLAALQLGGFMAVPDTPLMFFTALLFLAYRRFRSQASPSLYSTLLLGAVTALLLYSKYHGVLVVLFVLLSDWRLFTRYQTYLAGLIALLLYAPHLAWQYQHDWVSVRYHLFESNVNPYRISHTTDYLLGQLLLPGPLAGFILLPAALACRPAGAVERAMKFTLVGIYLFFLASTFRGKVEANWTAPVLVPLVVLGYAYLSRHPAWRRALRVQLPVTILLVLVARIALVVDFLPVAVIRERYHSWQLWPAEMKQLTHGLPVVFDNSYQRASQYWYHTGQPAYSLNGYRGRKNNYDFWPVEDSLLGRPVYRLDTEHPEAFAQALSTPLGRLGYRLDTAFVSLARIQLVPAQRTFRVHAGATLALAFSPRTPVTHRAFLQNHPGLPIRLWLAVFNHQGWVRDIALPLRENQLITPSADTVRVVLDLPRGSYQARLALQAGTDQPTHNSEKMTLTVD